MKTPIAKSSIGAAILVASAMSASGAAAQSSPRSPLLDLDRAELREEIEKRYDAAVAATLATEIKRADDSRYTWASETKVQCGIALGYLKSRTVDEPSINKCDSFYARMSQVYTPPAAPVAPLPAPAPAGCEVDPNVSIFFDWDVDAPPAEAAQVIQQIASARTTCGWRVIQVTGHADRSGSDAYNIGISTRRAENVAALLVNAGVPRSDLVVSGRGETQLKVETADGVREPQNRRVEVSASGE